MNGRFPLIGVIALALFAFGAAPALAQGKIMTFDVAGKLTHVTIPNGHCEFNLQNRFQRAYYGGLLRALDAVGTERALVMFADCEQLNLLGEKNPDGITRYGLITVPTKKNPLPIRLPGDQKTLNAAMEKNYFSWEKQAFQDYVKKMKLKAGTAQYFGKLFGDETAMYSGAMVAGLLQVTGTMNLGQRAVNLTLYDSFRGNPQELKVLAREVQEGVKAIRELNAQPPAGG